MTDRVEEIQERKWRQYRGRYLRVTVTDHGVVVWLGIGGRKPLAHLPRWKRRLLHLPSIRWRLWPRPWRQQLHRDEVKTP